MNRPGTFQTKAFSSEKVEYHTVVEQRLFSPESVGEPTAGCRSNEHAYEGRRGDDPYGCNRQLPLHPELRRREREGIQISQFEKENIGDQPHHLLMKGTNG